MFILLKKDYGKDQLLLIMCKHGQMCATRLKTFDPGVIKDYGYGKFPDVITSVEFEKMVLNGQILTKEGKEPKNLAIIHCVGSRNKDYHEYCSRVCRMTALKYSNQIIEKHPKLDPVVTTTDGVFIAGTCQGPKDIPDSVTQARATAARILATIAVGSVEIEPTTAVVNEDICCGCQTCIKVCPYTAISFNEEDGVSVVN